MTAGLLATDPVTLGPYQLLGRLGGGGMGQVYLGRPPGGELVAVKVIRPEFAADPEFLLRFAREVANVRNVSGSFTARLVDADTDGPVPWLATEYIAGPPLSAAVRGNGPLPLASLLPLATGLARALAAIHAARVVHRDLKPSNVLLAEDGPRVIDFGISHAVEASTLTQTGAVMGSPGYMSPEQAQGLPVGPPTDVFSLGAVLAYAAAGLPAFGTGSVAALVYRVVSEPPDLGQVPPRLRPLVEACLAKEPGDRPSLDDVLADVGSGLIRRDWLPAPVADTIARYEPAARLAEIAALGPPDLTEAPEAPEHPSVLPLAGSTAPSASGSTVPPGGGTPPGPGSAARHGKPRPAGWRRHRRRAVTVAAVAAVAAGTGSWLAAGTNTFGNHPGAGGAPDTRVSVTTHHGGGSVTSPPAKTSPKPTAPASPVTTPPRSPSPAGPATSPAPNPTTTSPAPATAPATAPASQPASAPATGPATAPATGPATGPAATQAQPTASTAGGLSGTGLTTYSCSDYPVGDASGVPARYQVINNNPHDVTVYFVASGGYAGGVTGTAPGNATTLFTLGVGGVYVLDDTAGGCIGAVESTSAGGGQITIPS